jgi:hypothetical protein
MNIYEKFFTEKRIEFYEESGISPNSCIMQQCFANELSKETGYRIKTGEFYKGIEIIIIYNTRCSNTLQFFRQIY